MGEVFVSKLLSIIKDRKVTGTSTKLRRNSRQNSVRRKYEGLCKQGEKSFLPFTFQTFGGMGSHSLDFFSYLKARPPSDQVYGPCSFLDSLRFRLSSRFMRLNGKVIIQLFHLISPLDEGGVVVNHQSLLSKKIEYTQYISDDTASTSIWKMHMVVYCSSTLQHLKLQKPF